MTIVTKKRLFEQVRYLNKKTGRGYVLNDVLSRSNSADPVGWQLFEPSYANNQQVSPVLKTREMYHWLHAFLFGYDIGWQDGHTAAVNQISGKQNETGVKGGIAIYRS